MKENGKKRFVGSILACCLLVLSTIFTIHALASELPAKTELQSGVNVVSNSKAVVDYSNLSEGIISIKYTGEKKVNIKTQITKNNGVTYTYNLNNDGNFETFPLTEGSGKYTIKVFENTTGNKYAQALTCSLELILRNEFLPFLYSNQYVNFTEKSATTKKAAELTNDKKTELAKITAIYDFVVNNFTYDKNRAKTVTSGYLPNVDTVLEEKKGICFDYAAVMAAMMRSQNIPCKLVIGYAGTIYHAWINVYTKEKGWINQAIFFDGETWKLMDPTFASTGKSSEEVIKYIGNSSNYTQKYAY